MSSRRMNEHGVSLIEVMVSLGIFAIGILGLLRMHGVAAGADGYAHHLDRATAVAQDLVGYLEQVDHGHTLLQDVHAGNNTDLLDAELTFQQPTLPTTAYDHTDAELPTVEDCVAAGTGTACAPPFRGLVATPETGDTTTPTLSFAGERDEGPEFERYWIVADTQTQGAAGDPPLPVKAITVVVRWRDGASGTFRRVTALGTAFDPALVTNP